MDKMHRQKIAEIEKLSATVAELEEAVLAGGAAVNAARDYQRQAQELLVKFMVFGVENILLVNAARSYYVALNDFLKILCYGYCLY